MKYDNMFSRFHTIPACYGQTDGRTDGQTDRRSDRIAISISRPVFWRAIKTHQIKESTQSRMPKTQKRSKHSVTYTQTRNAITFSIHSILTKQHIPTLRE